VPADDGLGFHEQHDVRQALEAAGQGTDEPAIESAQARAFDMAAEDDELLAKDQVFGGQGCSGRGQLTTEYLRPKVSRLSTKWRCSGGFAYQPTTPGLV
jgi:hypothetical protein